jgi:4'-phosphopantetheinyl transferase
MNIFRFIILNISSLDFLIKAEKDINFQLSILRKFDKSESSQKVRQDIICNVVRCLLPEVSAVEIYREKSGRPILVSNTKNIILPNISISHSGSWIACVLSAFNDPACIDIEDIKIPRLYTQVAKYAFSQEEQKYILPGDKLEFYKLWTAKEAMAKCQGKGLKTVLRTNLGLQLCGTPLNKTIKVINKGKKYELLQSQFKNDLFYSIARKYNTR